MRKTHVWQSNGHWLGCSGKGFVLLVCSDTLATSQPALSPSRSAPEKTWRSLAKQHHLCQNTYPMREVMLVKQAHVYEIIKLLTLQHRHIKLIVFMHYFLFMLRRELQSRQKHTLQKLIILMNRNIL